MLPRRSERYTAQDVAQAIVEKWPESATIEYKSDPALDQHAGAKLTPEQRLEVFIAKAVSAFANSGGGTLVLGVAERGGIPEATQPPGLSERLGRVRADERVDLIVTRCVEPRPACRVDFAEIDSERAYVVVDVAPRGGGPHRITNTSDRSLNGRYYVRRGRESVEADHHTLRALFAVTEEEAQRVRDYLARRGLADADDESPEFANREPARQLGRDGTKRSSEAVLVSVIPEILRGDIVDLERADIRTILDPRHSPEGTWPEERATLEGRMLIRQIRPPLLLSYLHVHRTGYVEVGDCRIFETTINGNVVYANGVDRLLEMTLDVSRRICTAIGMQDRVLVGVHLRNVADTRLGLTGRGSGGYNTRRHLTIEALVSVGEMGLETRVLFDRRLANAYARDIGLVLNADGSDRNIVVVGD